jgi:hypothetical protein
MTSGFFRGRSRENGFARPNRGSPREPTVSKQQRASIFTGGQTVQGGNLVTGRQGCGGSALAGLTFVTSEVFDNAFGGCTVKDRVVCLVQAMVEAMVTILR